VINAAGGEPIVLSAEEARLLREALQDPLEFTADRRAELGWRFDAMADVRWHMGHSGGEPPPRPAIRRQIQVSELPIRLRTLAYDRQAQAAQEAYKKRR
jgi:hypothetical protein